jgi:hypothetical protein
MAENSETGISADVLDDVAVTSNEILGKIFKAAFLQLKVHEMKAY